MYCLVGSLFYIIAVILQENGYISFTLDMKYSHYSNPVLVLLLPAASFVTVVYLAVLLEKSRILKSVISYIGSCSMIIMYIHMPIRDAVVNLVGEDYHILPYLALVFVIAAILRFISEFHRQHKEKRKFS